MSEDDAREGASPNPSQGGRMKLPAPPKRLHPAKRAILTGLESAGISSTAADARARAAYLLDRDQHHRNERFSPPDGLPMPPPWLVYLVVGHFDYAVFYERGRIGHAYILEVLRRGGVDPASPQAILDWGCGPGRVLRMWDRANGRQLYGSDYNNQLVAWARTGLPFARFATNGIAPPLAYPDNSFDLLYAISVFTHLPEPLQRAWIAELARVVAPGGHILITVVGPERARPNLRDDELERFDAGELIVFGDRHQGENYCAVYHPDAYVRRLVAGADLEIAAHVPIGTEGIDDDGQDSYLLRVPATP
jgi:SAM-dependent methyltransferase